MADRLGQQFGNYRLDALLGQGGYAEVYRGQHLQLNQRAAIKVLHAYLTEIEAEHFKQEAKTISTLVHPSIIRVFDYAVQDGIPFLVMEYAPNGSLRQRYPKGSLVPLPQIVSFVKQMAEALQFAHDQKVIHRDVKPENMLLGRHKEVLLSDFGVATIAHSSGSLSTQDAVGTPTYMAPEQIQGKPRTASDQYALGIVVYEWLCGSRPFEGSRDEVTVQQLSIPPPPLREHMPTISAEVEQVVLHALEKDPKARFASVRDFSAAFEQASLQAGSLTPHIASDQPDPASSASAGFAPVVSPEKPVGPNSPPDLAGNKVLAATSHAAPPAPAEVPLPLVPARPQRKMIAGLSVWFLIPLVVLFVAAVVLGGFSLFKHPGASNIASGGTTTHFGTTPTSHATTTITGVKGGTWVDDLNQDPDSLLPNASAVTFAAMVDDALWAPLVYGTPQGQLQPGLLTEVPTAANGGISTDLKTWTLHFKSGLKWSDGQPLDARDMDFTWKLWGNSKFSSYTTLTNNQDIASADVSSDNLTITFHLRTPLVSFMANWADGLYGPMPAHHFASMDPGSILKSSDNRNPSVVSGPFMMSESQPGDHYTVVRNPNYYQGPKLPYLDKVIFRIVPDQNTILTNLQSGTVDSAWFLDVSKATLYQGLSNYKLVADPNTYNFEALYFNFNNKVLANNLEVRQAMAMAVDQTTLIAVARHGLGGKLCTDHSAIQHPGGYSGPCPKFDLNAANALLDQHGWVEGADGVRSKNGQRLEFQYSTIASNLWQTNDELLNQQNFQKIGIKLDIQNYPASTFFGTLLPNGKPGQYDIAEFVNSVGYDPDDSSLFSCSSIQSGINFSFYCNHALDALYQQEQSTADPNARQAVFDQIHQIYLTDFPFIVELAAPDIAIHKVGTENYVPSLAGAGETVNIWEWWCDNGTCPA